MADYSVPAYVRAERRKRARLVLRGAFLIIALVETIAAIVLIFFGVRGH